MRDLLRSGVCDGQRGASECLEINQCVAMRSSRCLVLVNAKGRKNAPWRRLHTQSCSNLNAKGQMCVAVVELWNTMPSDVTERSAIDQRLVLAKPCCWDTARWSRPFHQDSARRRGRPRGCLPRIAFLPSKTAMLDVHSTSRPPGER